MPAGGSRRQRREEVATALDDIGWRALPNATRRPFRAASAPGSPDASAARPAPRHAAGRAFSKLDTGLRDEMRRLVFARVHRDGLPTLMVTHDRADAEAAGGPIIEL